MMRNALRVVDAIRDLHGPTRADHEAIADAVEHLEHDERAGPLVRQSHVPGERFFAPRLIAEFVLNDRALLIDCEHRTGREPVVGTAVEHDDLELADLRGIVRNADDLAIDGCRWSMRREIERR